MRKIKLLHTLSAKYLLTTDILLMEYRKLDRIPNN